MEIKITVRNIYGALTIYPACETARKFARIARTKTLTFETLEQIRSLGYRVVELHESKLDDKLKEPTQ